MKQNIIYIRTSTEEQNPQNQLFDCEKLAEKLEVKDWEVLEDKVSGWKELEREGFDKIKEGVRRREIKVLIVWDLDRIYRNRKNLVSFFELCKVFGCKIYSHRQEWLENLNKIQPPFNEIMFNLMLQILGWLAEEESNKKSERVKSAMKQRGEKTYSKFGNKWGRKTIITKRLIEDIKRLRNKGRSIRQITKEVYYYDRNKNKKNPSIALVHKLLSETE